MNKVKYILFSILFGAFLFYPVPLNAQAQVRWTQGKPVMVGALCREEKDIMEMVKADTESDKKFRSKMRILHLFQRCIRINPPTAFNIHSIIVSYIDSNHIETSVLALAYADNPKEIIAYTLAKGSISKDKQVRE
tara:strand:- start:4209 stop:4613 length:405 start_codon:yes stop_codon:yes gene_type:complete